MFEKSSAIRKLKVWEGENDEIEVGSARDIFTLRPAGYSESVVFDIVLNNKLRAPIKKGQKLGKIVVENYGGKDTAYDLIALEDVFEGGFFKRLIDSVLIYFEEDRHE